MSAITTALPKSWPVAKRVTTMFRRLFWSSVVLLAVYFFFKVAFHYFFINQQSYGRYWSVKGWLLLHICGGTLALFLGPLQFWTGLRRNYLRFHRWTGRLYLLGVAVGGTGAIYLSLNSPVSQAFGISLLTLTLVWWVSSAMALVAILRRQVAIHREWVTRSYVLTFAFVIGRILLDSPFLTGMGNPKDRLVTIIWLCWTVPLFLTEVFLQLKRFASTSIKSSASV
jgi:Predicted membrane protein (DUF2306)